MGRCGDLPNARLVDGCAVDHEKIFFMIFSRLVMVHSMPVMAVAVQMRQRNMVQAA